MCQLKWNTQQQITHQLLLTETNVTCTHRQSHTPTLAFYSDDNTNQIILLVKLQIHVFFVPLAHTHIRNALLLSKNIRTQKKCTIHTHTYTFSLKCIVANCCFYRRTAIRLREKIADERKTTKQRAKKKVLFEIYLKFNPTTNLNLLPVDVLGPGPEPTSKLTFAQIAAGWAHCHNSTMRW